MAIFKSKYTGEQIEQLLDDAKEKLSGSGALAELENMFDMAEAFSGYITTDGTFANASYPNDEVYSEEFRCSAGEKYTFQTWISPRDDYSAHTSDLTGWCCVCFYAAGGLVQRIARTNYESYNIGKENTQRCVFTFTVPTAFTSFRVSFRTYKSGYAMLSKGSEVPPYRPCGFSNYKHINTNFAQIAVSSSPNVYPKYNSSTNTFTLPSTTTILIDGEVINFDTDISISIPTESNIYCIYYDMGKKELVCKSATNSSNRQIFNANMPLIAIVRRRYNSNEVFVNCSVPVEVDGIVGGHNTKMLDNNNTNANVIVNENVKSINHRGFNTVAPENTLSAYKLSKKAGFKYVECDVQWTYDGVPVLLHDDTVDRTSDTYGDIAFWELAEIRKYDFGSWKSPQYAGEKIPTFEEFIILCRNIGLYPYIEIKAPTTLNRVNDLFNIVNKYFMHDKVTWISSNVENLEHVKYCSPKARIGYVTNTVYSNTMSILMSLKTDDNEVFLDIHYNGLTDSIIEDCSSLKIPIEVWTINGNFDSVNPYVSGFTSDSLIAGNELCNKYLNN